MKINFLFIFILFFSLSYEENSIIQIPNIKQTIIKNIKTKNRLIDYSFNVIIQILNIEKNIFLQNSIIWILIL